MGASAMSTLHLSVVLSAVAMLALSLSSTIAILHFTENGRRSLAYAPR
jgi:hypothetical protein